MRSRLFAPIALALAAGLLASPSGAAPVLVDRVVAVVDAQRIFRSDVARRARPLLARLGKADRAAAAELRREVFNRMVDEAIIEIDCARANIRVEPHEIDQALDSVAQQNNIDRKTLLAEAEKQGLSGQEYREDLRRQILDIKWVSRRIRPRIAEPSAGSEAEKARATGALIEAARKAELARLRREFFVELRW